MPDALDVIPAAAPATALLRERGAAGIEHPGGDLLNHLLRTHAALREWGASEALSLAGLCHAAYGTDGFRVPLFDLAERDLLRRVIGSDAEHIVYVYCACAREDTYARLGRVPLPLTDRFTGAEHVLDETAAADFAFLSICNELDIARVGNVGSYAIGMIAKLVEGLAPYAPAASARALAELA